MNESDQNWMDGSKRFHFVKEFFNSKLSHVGKKSQLSVMQFCGAFFQTAMLVEAIFHQPGAPE